MQARIVGPEEELGDVRGGLEFFGNHLTRDFSDIKVSPDQLEKLKGNRYVELKGSDAEKAPSDEDASAAQADAEAAETIRKRLDELGVKYADNASLKTLRAMLTKAETAQAAAEAEAEKAAAEAADKAAAATPAGSQA